MEWYAMQICHVTPADASLFGAIQIILLSAFYIFKIPFAKPKKK